MLSVSGLLLYTSKVLTLLPGTPNGCRLANGTRMCCSGFYEWEGTCKECHGSYGYNCTSPCPSGSFGPRCRETCTCSEEECDDVLGCIVENMTPKGLRLLHLHVKPIENVMILTSTPDNGNTSQSTNESEVLVSENLNNKVGIWGQITNLIKTEMHWFIVLVTVLGLSFIGICIITCRNIGRKKKTQQSSREHINHVVGEHVENHGNVYTDMPNQSVYTDINTLDETPEKEYMQRSHFFGGESESHDYCGLSVYADVSDVQTNVYTDIKGASTETTKGCGYMFLNDLLEDQTASHEYDDLNGKFSTFLSYEKDSSQDKHGSTEHVYMYI
ncbi:uncharacterized protein LOC134253621 [Saccostrea cucullata]|uniref:uncharacterized protein LOC134253621 n=1 Tax=Saccostrea cuccullata TaxID=36930 RepID=UPI002ED02904